MPTAVARDDESIIKSLKNLFLDFDINNELALEARDVKLQKLIHGLQIKSPVINLPDYKSNSFVFAISRDGYFTVL